MNLVRRDSESGLTGPLQSLLSSYDVLFSARCVKCKRVLPSEGYIPAVARSWATSPELLEGAQEAKWIPFHVGCQQS